MGNVCGSVGTTPVRAAAEAGPQAPCIPAPPASPPDPARYAVDVLTTERGILRGVWAKFEPIEWLQEIPVEADAAVDGPGVLRRLLIGALGLTKFAREKADIADFTAKTLGDGSFGAVWQLEEWPWVVLKVLDKPALETFELGASRNAAEASRLGIGPLVFGTGWVHQEIGATRRLMCICMEALQEKAADEAVSWGAPLLRKVAAISQHSFHNDLQMNNIMLRTVKNPEPVVIGRQRKVAVTSRCLEHDFKPVFDAIEDQEEALRLLPLWREYCDLTLLTLSVSGTHGLYRLTLARLVELFEDAALRSGVITPLFETEQFLTDEDKQQVPFEVCVREPSIQGVTVNLVDLAGNAFAHGLSDWDKFPSLRRSQGVYWPDS
eukprot:gnl/TRDRNA2_/TRDRNA2_151733_c0_seq3.p1 gnl/TRDRNA2_/TRDRNA2_151733_c0~~gnl/TRDRNA2_/TRDRNA2_151733_c0_seq3.p1  ORF type:complete len:379 (-),score=68.64 gnl/TRDRNA2_/TRDRNA2_151733_c0_seq3:154-1290(-)